MLHTEARPNLRSISSSSLTGPAYADENARLAQLERLAYWLDAAYRIPVLGVRFGFDALLDLIPGIGDAIGAVLSLYILQAARTFGVPRITMVRMAMNIAIDFVGGLLPFVGAVFDAYWKANIWNVGLIQRSLADNPKQSRRARQSDWFFVIAMVAAIMILVVGTLALFAWLIAVVVHQLR